MQYEIFIDGREGTTGIKIFDRLINRDDVNIVEIRDDKRKDIDERCRLIAESNLTILCLPDSASREIAGKVSCENKLIDASTAFRTDPTWVYGIPELGRRNAVKSAARVSVPGCHATGFIMIVKPLLEAGVIREDSQITANSITGYSGGGKKMIEKYSKVRKAPVAYGLGQRHKHIPEMIGETGLACKPIFNPVVSDYYSGMLVSVPVWGYDRGELLRLYTQRYEREPLVTVSSVENDIDAEGFSGRDDLQISVGGEDGRAVVYALYDNLGKGASGAAVQCMNLMLGLDEYKGLVYERREACI